MIIDLEKFIDEERPLWAELEIALDRMAKDPARALDLRSAKRLHYLYQRASSDLVKLGTFASEPELKRYLEGLVARTYGEIHETRKLPHRLALIKWFTKVLPQTFRRNLGAFWLATAITLVGALIGAGFALNPETKKVLLPFAHLRIEPHERVEAEKEMFETDGDEPFKDPLKGGKAMGTTFYITNNTRVAFVCVSLGMTWGIGTIVALFGNGVLLGAVCMDYIRDGQTVFLIGWLLPHGATEIPAILLAGQAGLMLARALIGWGSRVSMRDRFRKIGPDIASLIAFISLLLIWAGFVEAYLSQYHFIVPFWIKISFGAIELFLLFLYLFYGGREKDTKKKNRRAAS